VKGNPALARLTGRRRTPDEIRSIRDWYDKSGLSLLAFARKHGLCYATVRRWRAPREVPAVRPARPGGGRAPGGLQGGPPAFVPVEIDVGARAEDFVLEWVPGRSLRIPAGFDPGQLRRLLEVLGVRS
jgi:hypothetical protein